MPMLLNNIKIEYDILGEVPREHFDLSSWERVVTEIDDVHKDNGGHLCGMTACAGGYLARSQAWEAFGGSRKHDGTPLIEWGGLRLEGTDAISVFYGIPRDGSLESHRLRSVVDVIHSAGSFTLTKRNRSRYIDVVCAGDFYGMPSEQVPPHLVQQKLALFYFICLVLGLGE